MALIANSFGMQVGKWVSGELKNGRIEWFR